MRLLLIALSPVVLAAAVVSQERRSLNGIWELGPAAPDGGRPLRWQSAPVPAPFEVSLGADYDGVVWYRRTLPLDRRWRDRTIRIEFHAAATEAVVYCNDRQVGRHLGGWTPFRVDVTDALLWNGEDVLEVRVDEKVGHNTQGFLPVVQPHFGGLWQDVVLCADDGPVIDRFGLLTFGRDDGTLLVRAPILGGHSEKLRVEVRDGATLLASVEGAGPDLDLVVPDVRLWEPGAPNLYRVRVALLEDRRQRDAVERRVGFRGLRAEGTTVSWNGRHLQVRGVLHWGFSPPHLAPPDDSEWWRPQLETFKAMGCNLVKACLWVPPRSFYEVCDEIGLLVWQEYPTWHPSFTPEHRADLVREFTEFHRHDRSHASVAFRSLTCETGQGADLDLIRDLYTTCHEMVPDTLVVDDSSWIGWQRITDFWDDHPYGNNSWWPGKLQEFLRFIDENGRKPLLLGECMTGDTWVPLPAWDAAHDEDPSPWWEPLCLEDQRRFEDWLVAGHGRRTLDSLLPISLAYAMRNRKYQIERLRTTIPDAGYVMSVARDFPKARMGFFDDLDRLKWQPEEWDWHGDTMLCLATVDDRRAFVGHPRIAVRVAHSGRGPIEGQARLRLLAQQTLEHRADVQVAAGAVSEAVTWRPRLPAPTSPRRLRLEAELSGSHHAVNRWDLWQLPPFEDRVPDGVRVTPELSVELLDWVEAGGRALLTASPRKNSLKVHSLWYLRGAPFAPEHPVHGRVPVEMLLELQTFDLEQPFVMPWRHLLGQVDPILAFWETHDIPEVRRHLFAFDTRLGEGRLLATALDTETPAGRFVLRQFLEHLARGPAPERGLSVETRAALRASLRARTVPLREWRVRTDPEDAGLQDGWQGTDVDDSEWRVLRAGAHWEGQGLEHYDGVAWYRIAVDLPPDWQGETVHAVFEGVDDSYHLFVNGEQVARFGDPETGETVWLVRTSADVTRWLRPGERNVIALRVVDHTGAGGLWKPAFLTTGPVDAGSELLN